VDDWKQRDEYHKIDFTRLVLPNKSEDCSPFIAKGSGARGEFFLHPSTVGDESTLFFQNARKHKPNDIVSHPRRPESSTQLLWKPQISQIGTDHCQYSLQNLLVFEVIFMSVQHFLIYFIFFFLYLNFRIFQ
jgi:hypothetical protein